MNRRQYWTALVLLAGGAILLIPALYNGLAELSGGHYPHMIVGAASLIAAAVLFRS